MARFFTRELIDKSIELCNNDAEHLERAKLLDGKVILRALGAPEGQDVAVAYTFEAGRCSGYEIFEDPSPAAWRDDSFTPMVDGLARITANYETFAKLDRGELEPADALNSPDYKIDGNMMLLLPLMQAVNSFTEKIREIPKEY